MPLDHGGRLHQHHYLEATRPQPVEQDPEQPIDGDESPTARMLAMQDCHLVTQRDDLEFQFHAASKPTSEPGEECRDVCEHAGDITAVILKTPDIPTLSEFSVATGLRDDVKARYPAVPDEGGRRVVSILISVVLPAPFGPISPKISPCNTAIETSATAMRSPKRRLSVSVTTAGSRVDTVAMIAPSAHELSRGAAT